MNTASDNIPFKNDEKAVGKWEYYNTVKTQEDFDPNAITRPMPDNAFGEIYFLPDGEKYWIFEGWTKGYLFVHYGGNEPVFRFKYTIKDFTNHSFMFLQPESQNNSHIEVLKKVSSKRFQLLEIGRRDSVDIPFVYDERILGKWKSVGFAENIEDFTGDTNSTDCFWLREIVFFENGTVIRKYDDDEWYDKWSKGVLLDLNKQTVSHYFFKTIHEIEYLFLEWKMGNYVFGGMPPSYYVFTRKA